MALIGEEDLKNIQEMFSGKMKNQVTLALFTHGEDSPEYEECQFCDEMKQLLEEVAGTSDKIDLVVYDFEADREVRENYGVTRAPAVSIVGDKDYGVRYYGIPSGYEAQSLIEDIIDVSTMETGLSGDTMDWLTTLEKPVHLQVFVTPT